MLFQTVFLSTFVDDFNFLCDVIEVYVEMKWKNFR